MTHIPELEPIERRIWKRHAESGLTDILLGAILLASSVAAIALRTELPAPWPLVVYFVLVVPFLAVSYGINQKVILPRQGRIRPGPSAKSRRKKAMMVAFVSLGMTVLLVLLTVGIRGRGFDGPPLEADLVRGLAPIVMAAIILLFFGLTAHFLDNARLYLIGILYAIGVGGIMLYVFEGFPVAIAATAATVAFMLVMGAVILIRWVRSHPVPVTTEEGHEG
jgi:MFS family permease